jgi:voltage-gated potassium channel Kch
MKARIDLRPRRVKNGQILINNKMTDGLIFKQLPPKTDELIMERLEEARKVKLSDKRKRMGPLIDPYNCEVINECGFSNEMITKYDAHVAYMKNANKLGGSRFKYLFNAFGLVGDLFEIFITVSACVIYVLSTYYEEDNQTIFSIIDVVIASIFLADWFYHLYTTPNRFQYILSKMTVLDMLTIVPVYIEAFGVSGGLSNLSFFRMIRIFRVLRILRMYKAFEVSKEEDELSTTPQASIDTSGISKQIMILVVTLFSMLFIGAGVVNAIYQMQEDSYYYPVGEDFDFVAAFYYMIVTSSTLGYGDIYPKQSLSRMVSVILILTMVYIISDQLSKISQLMANYSKYDTQYNMSNHIVIIGSFRPQTLIRFLNQFYHSDHGNVKTRCLIMGEEYPPIWIINLLEDPRFEGKVKYLEGNPTSNTTLKKANIRMADSVFILTNQHEDNPESNDINAVLIARMIQDYAPFIKTYVQLVRPDTLVSEHHSPWHTVISVQQVKMGILGAAVHNPGFNTTIAGLYITSDANIKKGLDAEWLLQFVQGLAQEFYCVKISSYFVGMSFSKAVRIIYTNCEGILTIGVKTTNTPTHREEVLINPAAYTLCAGDSVFVITDDQKTAHLVNNYKPHEDPEEYDRTNHRKIAMLQQAFIDAKKNTNVYHCDLESGDIIELWRNDINGRMSNHIIVIGSIEGFGQLVQSVRAYGEQPICLLNPNDPDTQWEKIRAKYDNLFYFKGSMLSFQDLYNSAITDCHVVLILASSNHNNFSPDSDAVLGCRLIELCFPHVRILLELIDESYMRFLGSRPRGKYQKLAYHLWSKYLSGRIFFSSFLESLICQIYYNGDLMNILLRLMGLKESDSRLKKFQENSLIRTIKIPASYFLHEGDIHCRYSELFNDLLSMDPPSIPLAVVSKRFTAKGDETPKDIVEMKVVDYEVVFTNPIPTTVIGQEDSVICIGGFDPDFKRSLATNKDKFEDIEDILKEDQLLERSLIYLMLKKTKTASYKPGVE